MRLSKRILRPTAMMAACGLSGGSLSASMATHPFTTVCMGAEHPKMNVIFLQGITTKRHPFDHDAPPNPDEPDYHTLLDRVGKETGVRFVMPYSNRLCKGSTNSYCWGTGDFDSVAEVYDAIRKSAASCFSFNQPWGLMGFSNGGYHVGRIISQGHLPAPKWAIAVGSAGVVKPFELPEISRHTPFYLHIGMEDITREDAWRFYTELKAERFNVHYGEYAGGHELHEDTLLAMMRHVL